MALIEVYHTIASHFPVDPDHFTNAQPDILEGQFVEIDALGFVRRCGTATNVIGLAGDTYSQSAAATPYAKDIVINSGGGTRSTVNRVSDFYNEAGASGRMTVYMGVGEFLTDQYDTNDTFTPGTACTSSATGLLDTAAGNRKVGYALADASAQPSGVPGTEVEGSNSLGTFVRFALNVHNIA